ncbi:cysteine desulfurase / selenocysteine lyase [Candidatus Phytoplasma luffae]|uniref:cysteine desulfurase n=1 Tax=Loofah witches'-broom phytoplasma TaxID=35773 RepID=A0A975FIM4_LOWBP|nr:aminotransferase class V-fold PLP-dependent enzyme [Candidatus Phytoplasma luffae]QTX03168.1 cysteine desulfurase / selenocysteine lyase [Candidatus Phytoplasma luffae]
MKDNIYRCLFPIFQKYPDLVYLESSATSLKPQILIDSLNNFYKFNGLGNKSFGFLSQENSQKIIETRKLVAQFINSEPEEIIFTKGSTDGLNQIAFGLTHLIKEGDEIIVSDLEHNSSLLPWMRIAKQKKAKLVFIPLNEQYKITLENFKKVLNSKTKIVALIHVSHILGYITPIEEIVKETRRFQTIIILDTTQSPGHIPLDVKKLGIDLMVFTSHKMYGPFGLGILFGKKKILSEMKPLFVGGRMAQNVLKDDFEISTIPDRFEAGTPNLSAIIPFKDTLEWLISLGFDNIKKYEEELYNFLLEKIKKIKDIIIYNEKPDIGIVTFNLKNIHSHDVASFLAENNIYVSHGNICSHLAVNKMKTNNVVRVSLGIYNNKQDIITFIKCLTEVQNIYQR